MIVANTRIAPRRAAFARPRRGRVGSNQGTILIIALVALVVMAIVEGVLIQEGVSRRRQLVAEERRIQTEWLVEAGLERAAAKLAGDEPYAGEAWDVPAEELNGRDGAIVRIAVDETNDRPDRLRVHVGVDYPRDDLIRARQERDFIIHSGRKAAGDAR